VDAPAEPVSPQPLTSLAKPSGPSPLPRKGRQAPPRIWAFRRLGRSRASGTRVRSSINRAHCTATTHPCKVMIVLFFEEIRSDTMAGPAPAGVTRRGARSREEVGCTLVCCNDLMTNGLWCGAPRAPAGRRLAAGSTAGVLAGPAGAGIAPRVGPKRSFAMGGHKWMRRRHKRRLGPAGGCSPCGVPLDRGVRGCEVVRGPWIRF